MYQNGKKYTELFTTSSDFTIDHLKNYIEKWIDKYDLENNIDLLIEKEKTKQIELHERTQQIELMSKIVQGRKIKEINVIFDFMKNNNIV